MDVRAIERLMGKYEYSKSDLLLKEDLKMYYDVQEGILYIPDFFDYTSNSLCGTCGELMVKLYMEAKDALPEYHILRASGKEPQYFNKARCKHLFLIVSEEDILRRIPKGKTYDPQKIKKILSKDSWVVDPSFKKACLFSESEYIVESLIDMNVPYRYPLYDVIYNGCGSPLYINESEELTSLRLYQEDGNVLGINFRRPDTNSIAYPLCSTELREKAKEDWLLRSFIDLFSEAQIIEGRIPKKQMKWASIS